MRTLDKIITNVDGSRGAPFGRSNVGTRPTGVRIYDSAVPMVDGGAYDRGGAYWGVHNQLRVSYTKDLSYVEFYRVDTDSIFWDLYHKACEYYSGFADNKLKFGNSHHRSEAVHKFKQALDRAEEVAPKVSQKWIDRMKSTIHQLQAG